MILELFPPRITGEIPGKSFRGEIRYELVREMKDAFTAEVTPDRCLVQGGETGLLYAGDLLEELYAKHGSIPCGTYSDAPETEFRCYHIDLKKGSGGVEDIMRTLRRLRQMRIPKVLIEYENRILLDSQPGAAASDAFTPDEITRIISCAKENRIEVIPLLQCFGHLEYLLQLPDYKKYSESQSDFSQLCPLNDEAFEMWKRAFDEMRSLHPDSLYFHIGGDETRQLGKCPECEKFVKDHSKEELFFRHIDRVCRYVVQQGLRPVLWHDMLARAGRFDLLKKLPQETVLLYWEYSPREDSVTKINYDHKTLVSHSWIGKVRSFKDFAEAPKQFVDFIENAGSELPPEFRKFTVLPLLKPMQETSLSVFGATSLGTSPCGTLLGNSDRVFSNMGLWNEKSIDGMVVTRWAAKDSLDSAKGPLSMRDYQLMIAAELMWNRSITKDELARRYSRSFGGEKTELLADLLDMMVYSEQETFFNWAEHLVPEFAGLESWIHEDSLWLYKKYRAAMEAELLLRKIRSFIRNAAGGMTDNDYGKGLAAQIPSVKDSLREAFSDEYPPESLKEWLGYLFEHCDALFAGLEVMSKHK